MKIADFLNELADKVGNKNDQGLIDFLSRADIVNLDVSDAFCNSIITGTMSLEGAKNNPQLKKHFNAITLNGVDSVIANAINDFGIDAAEFEAEKDTYKKLRMLNAKVKELMEKKPDHSDEMKRKYDDLRKEYADLNKKMADTLENHKTELSSVREESNNHVLNFLKSNQLKGLPYADKERPLDYQMRLAQMYIDDAMAQKGARVVNEGGVLKLVQANDPGMDYMNESHKPVTYEDFVKKILADNKILSVSDPARGNPQPTPQPVHPVFPGQPSLNTSVFETAIGEAMANLNNQ